MAIFQCLPFFQKNSWSASNWHLKVAKNRVFTISKTSEGGPTMGPPGFWPKKFRKCYLYILEVNGYVFCQFQGYFYFSNFYEENYWNIDYRYLTSVRSHGRSISKSPATSTHALISHTRDNTHTLLSPINFSCEIFQPVSERDCKCSSRLNLF